MNKILVTLFALFIATGSFASIEGKDKKNEES